MLEKVTFPKESTYHQTFVQRRHYIDKIKGDLQTKRLREDLKPVTTEFYQSTYNTDFQGQLTHEAREQPLFEAAARLPAYEKEWVLKGMPERVRKNMEESDGKKKKVSPGEYLKKTNHKEQYLSSYQYDFITPSPNPKVNKNDGKYKLTKALEFHEAGTGLRDIFKGPPTNYITSYSDEYYDHNILAKKFALPHLSTK